MPTAIAIPQQLTKKGELVVIPRKEYEALLSLKKRSEFKPTGAQKKALARAEHNFLSGKTLSYDELIRKLGLTG